MIEAYAKRFGYGVVRDFTGHGIGAAFHSGLIVPHYDDPSLSVTMVPGMTFTIEPMLTLGTIEYEIWPDQWTAVTKDRKRTAQFEHTILVTESGHEILTLPDGDHPGDRGAATGDAVDRQSAADLGEPRAHGGQTAAAVPPGLIDHEPGAIVTDGHPQAARAHGDGDRHMRGSAVPFHVGQGLYEGVVHGPGEIDVHRPSGQGPHFDRYAGPVHPVGEIVLQILAESLAFA